MATNKPRQSITFEPDVAEIIESYRHKHKIKTTSRAVIELLEKGIDEFNKKRDAENRARKGEFTDNEKSLMQKYRNLDHHGRTAVDLILNHEHDRVAALSLASRKVTSGQILPGTATNQRQLPLYDYPASAGTGVFSGEGGYEMVEVSDDIPMCANFGVRITGDSMTPAIPDNSIVWVRQQPDVDFDEVCIVVINGEGYCKVKKRDGFASINPTYKTIKVNEDDNCRISGKVVYVERIE